MQKSELSLTNRIKDGLRTKLGEKLAITNFIKFDESSNSKKLRQELLDLKNKEDNARWQTLHNDNEHYQVVSEKESHQRGEYYVRIIYYELGFDLPAVKSKEELRQL